MRMLTGPSFETVCYTYVTNRMRKIELIPKVLIGIIIGTFIAMLLIGIYRVIVGEICSGFMGIKATCIEETVGWLFGIIAFPVLLLCYRG